MGKFKQKGVRRRHVAERGAGSSLPDESQDGGATPAATSVGSPAPHSLAADLLAPVVVLVVTLWVYVQTLQQSIPGGDSGELVAEACLLGVAHPPGYPLFTLMTRMSIDLARLISPVMSPAWAANLASAVCAALAAAFVSGTVMVLLSTWKVPFFSVTAALCFALSPLVWSYSVGAEVFAMNNMFVAALLFAIALYAAVPTVPRAMAGAFVCGLGLTNQHTLVLFALPVIVWVIADLVRQKKFGARVLGTLTAMFVAGLLPYAYLPWASRRTTPGSWGDLTTLVGFVRHLLRTEYGTFKLSPMQAETHMSDRLLLYWHHCVGAWSVPVVGLSVTAIGVLASLVGFHPLHPRSSRTRVLSSVRLNGTRVIAVAWVFYVVVFHYLANIPVGTPMADGVLARFWMQPDAAMATLFGTGCAALLQACHYFGRELGTNFQRAVHVLMCALLLSVPALEFVQELPLQDRSDDAGGTMSSYGTALLQALPPQSLLLSQTDLNWNTVRYLQACEHVRPDVVHLSVQLLPYPWFARQHHAYPNVTFPQVLPDATTDKTRPQHVRDLTRFANANMRAFPGGIYVDIHAVHDLHVRTGNQWLNTPFHVLPHGLTFRVVKAQKPRRKGLPPSLGAIDRHQWLQRHAAMVDGMRKSFSVAPLDVYPPGTWEHAAGKVFWDAHYQHALLLLSTALSTKDVDVGVSRVVMFRQAAELLLATLSACDEGFPVSYVVQDLVKNCALAHIQVLQAVTDEEQQRKVVVTLVPILRRYLNNAQADPDAPTFRRYYDVLSKMVSPTQK